MALLPSTAGESSSFVPAAAAEVAGTRVESEDVADEALSSAGATLLDDEDVSFEALAAIMLVAVQEPSAADDASCLSNHENQSNIDPLAPIDHPGVRAQETIASLSSINTRVYASGHSTRGGREVKGDLWKLSVFRHS